MAQKLLTVRVPVELFDRAMACAKAEERNLSQVVRYALTLYVQDREALRDRLVNIRGFK